MSASPVRENPIAKAAAQLRQVCLHLPKRPLSRSGCGVRLCQFCQTDSRHCRRQAHAFAQKRVLYGAPPAYTGIGRPRVHGNKFKLNDPRTWWTPEQMIEVLDPKLGQMRLRLWRNLHFQQSAKHPMHLIQVERVGESVLSKIQTSMARLAGGKDA